MPFSYEKLLNFYPNSYFINNNNYYNKINKNKLNNNTKCQGQKKN